MFGAWTVLEYVLFASWLIEITGCSDNRYTLSQSHHWSTCSDIEEPITVSSKLAAEHCLTWLLCDHGNKALNVTHYFRNNTSERRPWAVCFNNL